MTNYKYLCVDQTGKEITGSIAVADAKAARLKLKDKGLRVVSLEAAAAPRTAFSFKSKKIKDSDIYNMARELSVLLKAGLRIDNSLETIVGTISNTAMRETLNNALKDIRSGKTVAESFEKGGLFNTLMVSLIRVGESVGNLRMSFEQVASHLQFQIQFRAEIRNALTYPIFLIFASCVTLFVMFKFIIPKFFTVFGQDQLKSLPFASKVMLQASDFLNIKVFIVALAAGALIYKLVDMKKLIHAGYAYALSIPLMRGMIINLELSRFSYSMYTMLSSGIEFIKALRFSIDLIQNVKVKQSIEPSIKLIKEGRPIGEVFSQVELLPEIAANMITVGEKSGNMKEIFLELFNVFDDRFKRTIKRIVILVEPLIITVMGAVVGFIVISMILTVMSVGNIKF
ncbi:type II secretion system F family protein [Candidatus Magnetominusculus xianensis]|uniref:Type II secretion system protein GspF n=1 Tax=Candidatus Magnetominusculus xianensis TaxID=1748249 RepID=A0ABR5SH49_9BACT|nr:type II secretion system F family protein [Candidatus Magnetominusculus xianensis]KWT90987.1 type II secretion system protein GspF [Candidatus Magnetominusculus xianensis]MBF0403141.1 type II secretion system F family protein [Nitrospirota bacterium]